MRPAIVPIAVRSRSIESAPRHCASSGGKSVPMSPLPPRAEDRVDHRVGDDVGVGVALEPLRVVDLDPAEDELVAVGEAVGVVADADHRGAQPTRAPSGAIRRRAASRRRRSPPPRARRGTRPRRS